jgi:hypothetical protein
MCWTELDFVGIAELEVELLHLDAREQCEDFVFSLYPRKTFSSVNK